MTARAETSPAPPSEPTPRFGSSGIRGPYAGTATPDLALGLGRALALLGAEAVLGRDARLTSPVLAAAVAAGAASAGVAVRDAGLVPTPTAAFGARGATDTGEGGADLAVMVTASHNPPPDNGFKVFGPGGGSIGTADRERIEAVLAGDGPTVPAVAWDEVATIEDDPSLAAAHGEALVDAVTAGGDGAGADLSGLHVALDGGHGPGGPFTAALLEELGCGTVERLFADPDGRFPGRPSEPTPDNLADLRALVRGKDLDLGLAHDGDADRLVAVDEAGDVLAGDELLILFVQTLDVDRVVVPVDTTMALEDACPGVDVHRTRVGDAYISEALRAEGGGFGGEPSGSWIFPSVSLCPDGPHAALRLAALVAAADEPLSALRPETYPMRRAAYPCPEADKAGVVEAFASAVEALGPVDRTDGVRVQLDDGWALVRPSGTEPKVRLTVEARDADALDEMFSTFEGALKEALP